MPCREREVRNLRGGDDGALCRDEVRMIAEMVRGEESDGVDIEVV